MMNFNNDNSTYTQRNDIDLYFDANSLFEEMIDEINKAEKFIHMEFYIFKSDEIGKKILQV